MSARRDAALEAMNEKLERRAADVEAKRQEALERRAEKRKEAQDKKALLMEAKKGYNS